MTTTQIVHIPALQQIQQSLANQTPQLEPMVISHIANQYRCYLNQRTTFFTRVEIRHPFAFNECILEVVVPVTMQVESYGVVHGTAYVVDPQIASEQGEKLQDEPATKVSWALQGIESTDAYEFAVTVKLIKTEDAHQSYTHRSQAKVVAKGELDQVTSISEVTTIQAEPQSSYMRYLPSIYEQDVLASQFLTIFEAAWNPLEFQIAHIEQYFDPMLSPLEIVKWLMSWFDLTTSDLLPEQQMSERLRYCFAELIRPYTIWTFEKKGEKDKSKS